jgi:multidrug efflux pump
MSRFFIERPIFSWVVSIAIMLGGLLALTQLSISQYPDISPPSVRISANYPGADAATVENSVTKVIEQGMTGVDNLDYMSSSSTSTGGAQISLTFKSGTDPDIAQMQAQNKLQLVQSQLPQIVQTNGVTVTKSSSGFLMVVGFVSEDGSMSDIDIADYVDSNLNDTIKRTNGVGETQIFGSKYAMRVWMNPQELEKYALMPSDIVNAIKAQNAQVSAGQLGALPQHAGQQLNVTVTARARLQTPEEFEKIILKSDAAGAMVRLGDVARVEIGAESYTTTAAYNGMPAAGLAINLATGANAISTAEAVRDTISRLEPSMPKGLKGVYPYDTSPFVKLSIEEVVKTLAEAVVLVFVVMFVFLQNFRATLIPTLAVPVVLLGTLGVLSVAGYSINTLTMFAMVLAIGLLVDDAIVVVENVERVMEEDPDAGPKEATIRSMKEITGALVGIATVLSAVFIPMAFFGGSVGVIYRQFSVTIVSAMVLSVIVALVFTPALCATLLKRPKHHAERRGIFGLFNRGFQKTTDAYSAGNSFILSRGRRFVALFVVLVAAMGFMFTKLPGSFLPQEDQGILITSVQLPVGATQDRTLDVLRQVQTYYQTKEKDAVEGVFSVAGFGFSGGGQNAGLVFVRLKDFDERKTQALSAAAIAGRAMGAFSQIRDAQVYALAPPAIQGLGNSNGFSFFLKDMAGSGHEKLMESRNVLLGAAATNPKLQGTRPNGQEDTPQFAIDIDQEKASAMGLSLTDIDATLSAAWGSSYVNDFIDRGRIKPVYLQGDEASRMQPSDLAKWHVRNSEGKMVPFSSFATTRWTYGSPRLERFNGAGAVEIQGAPALGVSSGEAMAEIDAIVASLPGAAHEWTGLSYQEKLSGNQATGLYAVSVLVVFLALAALYESWSIPFAVMLSVPLGVLGALVAAIVFGQTNDVYFKVGLLTTIGLAAKNAILIVEFAKERQAAGRSLVESALEASRQRLRPILMTSFAFMLGVLPLALATGAGSGAQNAIGVGVLGGMIAATALGVFFVPLLFVTVRRALSRSEI